VDRYFYFASFIKNQVQFVTLVQIKASSNEGKTSSDHDKHHLTICNDIMTETIYILSSSGSLEVVILGCLT
jgi:hypothetical protein